MRLNLPSTFLHLNGSFLKKKNLANQIILVEIASNSELGQPSSKRPARNCPINATVFLGAVIDLYLLG